MSKVILKDVFSNYEPTDKEKVLIQREIKQNSEGWWIITLLMNAMFAFSAFMIFKNGEISFSDDTAFILYIFIAFIVFMDSILFYQIFKSMSVNVNDCNFSKGLLLKTWRVHHNTNDSSSNDYYGTIKLDNDYIINSVSIDYSLYQKDLHTVIVVYHKNRILHVIERQ